MTTPQPDSVHLIPLDEIDAEALPRDRVVMDERPLFDLTLSIGKHGLRMPIELWKLTTPRPPLRYGLISGFRRLAVFRDLAARNRAGQFTAIPAFVRQPDSMGDAMAKMIDENASRVDIGAWERARIILRAVDEDVYPTIDEAVAGLFPMADRNKRSRLRMSVPVVEELEDLLVTPERLSQNQMMKIAAGFAAGYGYVIETALRESKARTLDAQWKVLKGVLAELGDDPEPGPVREGYPRRVVRPRQGLTIRRERTREGWSLHFTGRDARGGLMDDIMDEVERLFGTG